MQLMAHALGGTVAPAPQREFGHATRARRLARRPARALRRRAGGVPRLGEPRRLRRGARPPASPSSRRAPTRRSRRWPTRRARSTRSCSIRKSSTRSSGLEILRNFAYGVCGCTGDWTMASFVEEATARIRAQVGDGRVVCALSGGVDSTVAALIIHRAIGDRLTCIFVDNGVLRLDEARRSASGSSGCSCRSCSSTRRRCFSIAWPASTDPGEEAEDHRRDVHRRVRSGGGQARAGRFPGAGHAVSGRHRVGVHRRPVVADQEPSQRRRPARADADEAGRAAARAVQGRSARGRTQAAARRGIRRPPAVPGPGPRGAHPRRDHAGRARTCCAAPTPSSPKK